MATDSIQTVQKRRFSAWLGWARTGTAAAADLLFPPQCLACDEPCEPIAGEQLLCTTCRQQLVPPDALTCQRCAMPCPETEVASGACPECRSCKFQFAAVRTIGLYQGNLRQAILRLKHSRHEPLATALGEILAERIRRSLSEPVDLVASVPMFWLTRSARGTNAAETMAAAVARRLGLSLATDLVVCRRYLKTQAKLRAVERRQNVRHAFRASWRYNIRGAHILLVDDVLTTGATAHEVARALRQAGASAVFVAAAARGTGERK